jgi:hypothetical protein
MSFTASIASMFTRPLAFRRNSENTTTKKLITSASTSIV